MIEPGFVQVMAAYNKWMNEKIYAGCSELPDDELRRDRRAFFGSIFATLDHLYFTDSTVLEILSGARFDLKPFRTEQFETFDELRDARVARDQDIIEWSAKLTPPDLEGDVDYGCPMRLMPGATEAQSRSEGLFKVGTFPRKLVLMHYFNHQAHHRGQVTTLLSQMDLDVGQTDLWGLPASGIQGP